MTAPTLAHADAPARCAPLADLFADFRQTGPGADAHLAAQLASVCAGCALLRSCRAAAIADPTIPGFAGGLTPGQRNRARKARP